MIPFLPEKNIIVSRSCFATILKKSSLERTGLWQSASGRTGSERYAEGFERCFLKDIGAWEHGIFS
jgi:hypothetical protein